jgi:hypothetical protein
VQSFPFRGFSSFKTARDGPSRLAGFEDLRDSGFPGVGLLPSVQSGCGDLVGDEHFAFKQANARLFGGKREFAAPRANPPEDNGCPDCHSNRQPQARSTGGGDYTTLTVRVLGILLSDDRVADRHSRSGNKCAWVVTGCAFRLRAHRFILITRCATRIMPHQALLFDSKEDSCSNVS